MRCMTMEVANMSTRLKRWARAIQEIDLSKKTDPEAIECLLSQVLNENLLIREGVVKALRIILYEKL